MKQIESIERLEYENDNNENLEIKIVKIDRRIGLWSFHLQVHGLDKYNKMFEEINSILSDGNYLPLDFYKRIAKVATLYNMHKIEPNDKFVASNLDNFPHVKCNLPETIEECDKLIKENIVKRLERCLNL